MNPPFYVRLESGLYLNLSQIIVIHPRQPNGSIRVQVAGSPLIVISPVTDEDEQNIRTAVAMLEEWLIQQLDSRNQSPVNRFEVEDRIPMTDEEIVRTPKTRRATNKPKKKRRRRRVAA